jgi:hypothetical protein
MPTLDIFSTNPAFKMMGLMSLVENVPYVPAFLGSLPNLFTPLPVRTQTIPIEIIDGTIKVVQTSQRGEPAKKTESGNRRKLIDARAPRIAVSDTLYATEIADIRAYGSTTELMQIQDEITRRFAGPVGLMAQMELTREFHRLGAIDGKVIDADGATIIDWYAAMGVNRPVTVEFDFAAATAAGEGVIRQQCRQLHRDILNGLGGVVLSGMSVIALCGDEFFDKMVDNPETRATYLNQQEARQLRSDGLAYSSFTYGEITWVNYRGTADGAVSIPSDEFRAFPNAPGMFEVGLAPGEFMDTVNMPGKKQYPLIIPDKDRNMYVDLELYAYPLHICKRPQALRRGKIKPAA